MKNVLKAFGIIALVAVIGFSFIACDNDNGDDGKKEDETPISSFAGTWNASGGRSIVFNGSTFNYKVNGTTIYSGTFSVSGSTITFKESSLGTASGGYSLSGTTLTLSNHTWDSSVNGTYTKSGGGNTSIDTTALDAAITEAAAARDGVVKASAATEVPTGKKWVTESEWNAFDSVYITAIAAKTNPSSQSAVDTAKTSLQAAIVTFNAAKKNGSAASIKLSGTITVKNNGQIVPYLMIQAHASNWSAFSETIKVSLSAANTPWEIITKPLSSSVKISFDITGYNNAEYENPLFSGYNVDLNTSVYNTDVNNININLDLSLITVSGTFNLDYKGQTIPSIQLDINRKSDGVRLGLATILNAGNNTPWSIMIPSQTVDTDVVFNIVGFDGPLAYVDPQLFALWGKDFGVKVKNQNKTGIALNFITISGMVNNIAYNGGLVPTVDISLFKKLSDDDWEWITSTTLNSPSANTPWSIIIPAYTSNTEILVDINGKKDDKELFSFWGVATRTVKNTNVSGIALNFITLSGTIDVTYNSKVVPIVEIHIDRDEYGDFMYETKLYKPAKNAPWSILIPAYTSDTKIYINVGGFDEDEEETELFWTGGAQPTVKDKDVSGITLNPGNITDIASFAGTWNASGNRSIVFSGSNFTYKVNGTTTYSGTFSVSGSTITFNATGLGTASGGYSLSGTTLTLSNHTWDSSVNGTYTKDGGTGGGGGDGSDWIAITPGAFVDVYQGTTYNVDISAIDYGNNKFVAVGKNAGDMAYSSDGINWTKVADSKLNNSVNCIVWGNNKFVAGGYDGKMAYSSDGINWTAVTDSKFTGTSNNIYGITWGNNKFVAVGDGGKAAYSSDGTTWTAVSDTKFGSSQIYAVTFGNDKFVAVGKNSKAAYSPDGITWTAITNTTIDTSWDLEAVTWGNNKFVAVGGRGSTAYSSDGITWTAKSASNIFGTSISSTTNINGVVWGNGKFVAVGGAAKMAYWNGN